MRKYVLPLALFTAIGVVVVVLVRMSDEGHKPPPPVIPEARGPVEPEPVGTLLKPRRPTRTSLRQNHWLSELERALGRKDMSEARQYRARVCEQLDVILESEILRKNLFDDIREALEKGEDHRDVVMPMLRVIEDPEATRMIEEEFYRTEDPAERMTLLEAMSHEYHNPETASIWAIDMALNTDSAEHREHAFAVISDFSGDQAITFRTAKAIYDGTTRPKQSVNMIREISRLGLNVEEARTFMRSKLKSPRPRELEWIISEMPSWGDEHDAAQLETLAMEFPAMGDVLRERAGVIRLAIREKKRLPHEDPKPPVTQPSNNPGSR